MHFFNSFFVGKLVKCALYSCRRQPYTAVERCTGPSPVFIAVTEASDFDSGAWITRRDQGKYNYEAVRRWGLEKRLKMWGQVRDSHVAVPASLSGSLERADRC